MSRDGVTPEVLETAHERQGMVAGAIGVLDLAVSQLYYEAQVVAEQARAREQYENPVTVADAIVERSNRQDRHQNPVARAEDAVVQAQTAAVVAEAESIVQQAGTQHSVADEAERYAMASASALDQARQAVADTAEQQYGMGADAVLDTNAEVMRATSIQGQADDEMTRLTAALNASRADAREVPHA
jgi:hypothetical protein